MKRFFTRLMMVAALLAAGAAQAEAQLGKDYTLLNPPQPTTTSKIEVLEFFFYECSHCFHLHPFLSKWEKTKASDVEITFVPTMFRDSTEPLAHAYYTLQGMGQIERMDDLIYKAIHEQQIGLYDQDTISAFVAKNGVDKARFESAYNSFSVASKVTRAKQMLRSYNIQGTPTLIVDGRYVITGLQPEDTIRVLDEVIAMVRKGRPSAAISKHKKH
jgi:thiol:disulfide interchange protein DsbA